MAPRDPSSPARYLSLTGAALLVVAGVFLLVAVSYAPGLLGLSDDLAAGLALLLRALGLLALLGAGGLVVWSRREH